MWDTDANGNITTNALATTSGSNTTLESLETSFQQDLNGDGTVGVPAHTSPAALVASVSPAAPAQSFVGSDGFAFRPDLGATAGSAGAAPAALQQIEQLVLSSIQHIGTELQHVGTELQHIIAGDLSDLTSHDSTSHGPLFDLVHGFIIH